MPKQIRPKEIKLRLSLAEHQRLLDLAGNVPLAVFLRNVGLGDRELDLGPAMPPPTVAPELLRQIATIGNNLNQIARAMNSVDISAGAKIEHLATLQRIETLVARLAR